MRKKVILLLMIFTIVFGLSNISKAETISKLWKLDAGRYFRFGQNIGGDYGQFGFELVGVNNTMMANYTGFRVSKNSQKKDYSIMTPTYISVSENNSNSTIRSTYITEGKLKLQDKYAQKSTEKKIKLFDIVKFDNNYTRKVTKNDNIVNIEASIRIINYIKCNKWVTIGNVSSDCIPDGKYSVPDVCVTNTNAYANCRVDSSGNIQINIPKTKDMIKQININYSYLSN